MKIKTRRESGLKPEAWFLRELRLLAPEFYPRWNRRRQVWEIVKDAPVSVFRKGFITEYLVSKRGRFAPLDRRVIEAIRRLLYEKQTMRSLDETLQQIDRENEMIERRNLAYAQDGRRQFLKKCHEEETTHSVFLNRGEEAPTNA